MQEKFHNKVDELQFKSRQEEEKQKEQEEALLKAFGEIFKGNNGIYVAKYIHKFCKIRPIGLDAQDLAYCRGKEDVWAGIARFLPRKTRINVEIGED